MYMGYTPDGMNELIANHTEPLRWRAEQAEAKVAEKTATIERLGDACDALKMMVRIACADCCECARQAYSDATTPGFFDSVCLHHRQRFASIDAALNPQAEQEQP